MKREIKQGGFTLIQVMFVISIVGVVMYLSLENQVTAKKIKKTADFNTQVAEISQNISSLLDDPYVCSASVEGVKFGSIVGGTILGGGTAVGKAVGGDVGFTRLKNAVYNTRWNDVPRAPGTNFYYTVGSPHLIKGAEFRSGVLVTDMRLLKDNIRFFIRMTFEPKDTLLASKMGGKVINKDFYLHGKLNDDGDELVECNSLKRDEDLREVCILQKGVWNAVDKKCVMKDLIEDPADKIAVWIHSSGVLKTTATYSRIVGTVTCPCDIPRRRQCARAPRPCICALPSCESRFAACRGNSCVQGEADNFNVCSATFAGACVNVDCIYAKPCGLKDPPSGHVIKMEQK